MSAKRERKVEARSNPAAGSSGEPPPYLASKLSADTLDTLRLVVFSIGVAVTAFLVSKFAVVSNFGEVAEQKKRTSLPNEDSIENLVWSDPPNTGVLMTEEELSKYDRNAEKVYLSIIGEIYDVTSGEIYREGGYGYFVANDCSVGFQTGNPENCTSKITELPYQTLDSVVGWSMFYRTHENYTFVGKLIGEFYDENGEPTESLKYVVDGFEKAKVYHKQIEDDRANFPTCRKLWKREEGSTLWCKDNMLQVRKRKSPLVPRMRTNPISGKELCVCVEVHVALKDKDTFRLYDNCDQESQECKIPPK
mmetsp:Transcript_7494/g.8619  ORF Transcript_7494/g.8619 Transcript_7494/m.8619 type:complete len:307 (+) Transcript_7494:95-1015(+)|eukprot:CAMPEP_0184013114 /NCGR_PEP_ID=MMETSP0954-20121128/4829_1 /TAXON_ID=627963 /ORGANISM="Aplanochytrium sp, Strain PBS07" /LENGTH=306 /DNA_ID=CAMNT_0026293259 /DNA_START=73 /DNA_END=993 /DNA_ORIENTATION=+